MNTKRHSTVKKIHQSMAFGLAVVLVLMAGTAVMSQGKTPEARPIPPSNPQTSLGSAITDTELVVLETGVRAVLTATIPCTFTGAEGSYTFECIIAAGHSNSGSVFRLEDENEAQAIFEAVAGERPRSCIYGYDAAEWQESEGTEPGLPMLSRRHISWASRWLFQFEAFDDTGIEVAAAPRDLAEAVYVAAGDEGLFPLGDCPEATETATPEATPEPTAEPTETATVEPTIEPTPTMTGTPEATEEPTPGPSPTAGGTAEPTEEPTPGPSPTPSETPEPTEEPTPGPSPTPTEPLPGDLEIYGYVHGAGEPPVPLADALVTVTMCVPRSFSERTGADGSYRLLIPAEYANACATITLSVTAPGYEPVTQEESIAALRESPNRNFVLTPAPVRLYLPFAAKDAVLIGP